MLLQILNVVTNPISCFYQILNIVITVIPVLVAAAFNNFATKNPLKFDTYAALTLGRLLKYTVNRNLVIFYCLFSRLLKLGGSYHAAAFNTGITVFILYRRY